MQKEISTADLSINRSLVWLGGGRGGGRVAQLQLRDTNILPPCRRGRARGIGGTGAQEHHSACARPHASALGNFGCDGRRKRKSSALLPSLCVCLLRRRRADHEPASERNGSRGNEA